MLAQTVGKIFVTRRDNSRRFFQDLGTWIKYLVSRANRYDLGLKKLRQHNLCRSH